MATKIGMGDNIWLDDRNGVRTPMQWDATSGAGFLVGFGRKVLPAVIQGDIYAHSRSTLQRSRPTPIRSST